MQPIAVRTHQRLKECSKIANKHLTRHFDAAKNDELQSLIEKYSIGSLYLGDIKAIKQLFKYIGPTSPTETANAMLIQAYLDACESDIVYEARIMARKVMAWATGNVHNDRPLPKIVGYADRLCLKLIRPNDNASIIRREASDMLMAIETLKSDFDNDQTYARIRRTARTIITLIDAIL